jgi:hypothetical protein
MNEREALKLALEALEIEEAQTHYPSQWLLKAITAIKDALAQPEQKPVAWRAWFDADNGARWLFSLWPEEERLNVEWTPLYTTPPQRKPLTADEISEISIDVYGYRIEKQDQFARAIEAAHGIKE